MSLIPALGWLAAASGPVTSIPQLVRLLRARTSAGLSLPMWQLQAGALTGWAVHGYHLGFANILAPNLVSLAGALLVLHTVVTDRRLRPVPVLAPAVAVAAALYVIEYVAPAFLFGFAAMVPLAVGAVSQARDLVREPDVSGVSPAFLVLGFFTQALWLTWGSLVGDHAILVCSGVLGVLGAVTLGLAWARAHGRVSPVRPPADLADLADLAATRRAG